MSAKFSSSKAIPTNSWQSNQKREEEKST